jgi:hypothetical protein
MTKRSPDYIAGLKRAAEIVRKECPNIAIGNDERTHGEMRAAIRIATAIEREAGDG